MSAPILLPVGSVTVKIPPVFVSPQHVRPPTSFDASAVDTSVTVGQRWGFHPVNLSDWNQPLALKIMYLNSQGDAFEDEMQWYSWLHAQKIGPAFYGAYEFAVKDSSDLHLGLLMELILGDPLMITGGIQDFDTQAEETHIIQQRWNKRSQRDWARIKNVIVTGNVKVADLEILLSDSGRLTVIDPGQFSMGSSDDHKDSDLKETHDFAEFDRSAVANSYGEVESLFDPYYEDSDECDDDYDGSVFEKFESSTTLSTSLGLLLLFEERLRKIVSVD